MQSPIGPVQYDTAGDGRPKALVLDPIHPDGVDRLRSAAHVDIVDGPALDKEQLLAVVDQYEALIVRSRTLISAAVIEAGTRLRIVVRAGVGLDNIDLPAAEKRGVEVANCPHSTTLAVAEHTFALLLGIARHVADADRAMKEGQWRKGELKGVSLAGKTIGIVGFGRVGREVAKRAQAFEMRVLVCQTSRHAESAGEWRIELVDLAELLTKSDFISLHVPLRPANLNLIGVDELAMMSPRAFLINTARGAVVDEAALLAALNRGQIAGAALDVYVGEPSPNPALTGHPRVLATPHIAASTVEGQQRVAMDAADKVVDALQRKRTAETLSLRVVPVVSVMPHEAYHPKRARRLGARLVEDGYLANPPLVAETEHGYVILDGATRVTAFQQLGYPHIVVQVVDTARDNVQLHTWHHAVHGCDERDLFDLAEQIEGLHVTEMDASLLAHALWERNALGFLVGVSGNGCLLEMAQRPAGPGRAWATVLERLVDAYGATGDVERTLVSDIDELRAQYIDLAGLFVYAQLSSEIVLRTAAAGQLMPAGLTRFVIPGRILRLNAPLDILAGDMPLRAKADWLDGVVKAKLSARSLRYYEEPVMLLDE